MFCFVAMASKAKGSGTEQKSKKKDGEIDIYSKFIEFLKSPIWALPIMSFIEQRSLVFDTQGEQKSYKQIHAEFRAMVDMLVQCFCEDLGIKPDKVTQMLNDGKNTVQNNVEASMLEPVIAAQDFEVFTRMMIRKNIELQLQALQMIEVMCGLIPAVLLPGGPGDAAKKDPEAPDAQENIILIQVLQQSQEDFEKYQKERQKEAAELEEAMKLSLKERERLQAEKQNADLLVKDALKLSISKDDDSDDAKEAEEHNADLLVKDALKLSISKDDDSDDAKEPPQVKSARVPSAEKSSKKMSAGDLAKSAPSDGKSAAEIRAMMKSKNPEEQSAEIAERREYLMRQRDKLLNMKREARMKAFAAAEVDAQRQRPRTAKAAKSALSGRGQKTAAPPALSADVLEARIALAQKLKAEVMGV